MKKKLEVMEMILSLTERPDWQTLATLGWNPVYWFPVALPPAPDGVANGGASAGGFDGRCFVFSREVT